VTPEQRAALREAARELVAGWPEVTEQQRETLGQALAEGRDRGQWRPDVGAA
jgi:hypothetical protein